MKKRTIVVYYFTDSTRTAVIKGTTRWYVYPRAAKATAHDAMDLNLYGAGVAIVYDDELGRDLYIFTRDIEGRVVTSHTTEALKQKNLATSRDQFGEFTKKLAKSANKREKKDFTMSPNRKNRLYNQ